MISVDTSKTSDDLQKYLTDVKRRLENMVAGFAYELTVKLVEVTPIGNADILAADPDELNKAERAYYGLYQDRAIAYPRASPMEVGYHKSAWTYSESGRFEMQIGSGDYNPSGEVYEKASTNYKLGDTFYIGAKGFPSGDTGDTFLEFDQGRGSEQAAKNGGIKEPAWTALASTYAVDLQRYYNEG